jgi:predicted CoA-binding protein
MPDTVARFLRGRRYAVAGVSRSKGSAANAIFEKLRQAGFAAVPINPNMATFEGVRCFPDLTSVPGDVDGLVFAAHPRVAPVLVLQCREKGVDGVWFHRSFGRGSVSEEAVRLCGELGIPCLVGGCPLMYLRPVDIGHRCLRWWLSTRGRVPA